METTSHISCDCNIQMMLLLPYCDTIIPVRIYHTLPATISHDFHINGYIINVSSNKSSSKPLEIALKNKTMDTCYETLCGR